MTTDYKALLDEADVEALDHQHGDLIVRLADAVRTLLPTTLEPVAWVWTDRYGEVHHLSRIDGDRVDAVLFDAPAVAKS